MIFFKRIFDSNTKMDTEVKEIEYVNFGMFSSEEILKKTNNYNVAKLAKNIIQEQQDEIDLMKKLL
jgi:hypothetical protein